MHMDFQNSCSPTSSSFSPLCPSPKSVLFALFLKRMAAERIEKRSQTHKERKGNRIHQHNKRPLFGCGLVPHGFCLPTLFSKRCSAQERREKQRWRRGGSSLICIGICFEVIVMIFSIGIICIGIFIIFMNLDIIKSDS